MNNDHLTVVGPNYFQPIADLLDKMLSLRPVAKNHHGVGYRENGYALSIIVLLVTVLESYTSRLHFSRREEIRNMSVPDLLAHLFRDLPNHLEIQDVFLVRNSIIHNHVWHVQDAMPPEAQGTTISAPPELSFHVNQHYAPLIDTTTRRTKLLSLNASPSSVNQADVLVVFQVVWATLTFMNSKSFADTPLAGGQVCFQDGRLHFSDLIERLRNAVKTAL